MSVWSMLICRCTDSSIVARNSCFGCWWVPMAHHINKLQQLLTVVTHNTYCMCIILYEHTTTVYVCCLHVNRCCSSCSSCCGVVGQHPKPPILVVMGCHPMWLFAVLHRSCALLCCVVLQMYVLYMLYAHTTVTQQATIVSSCSSVHRRVLIRWVFVGWSVWVPRHVVVQNRVPKHLDSGYETPPSKTAPILKMGCFGGCFGPHIWRSAPNQALRCM